MGRSPRRLDQRTAAPVWHNRGMRHLLLGLCLVVPACGPDAPDASGKPNVLVITIDSLRADHVGCYGYDRATTPHLDALAAEGVRFDDAYTHAPFTAPSHASLLTSLNIKTHGVHAWAEALSDTAHNLAERLGPVGYRTGAFYNHPGLVTSNITRGFDHVSERTFEEAERTADDFLAWVDAGLAEDADQPFATWLHMWDVHRPYGYRDWTPEFFAERVERDSLTLAYEETTFGAPEPPTTVAFGRTEAHYNLNPERLNAIRSGRTTEKLRTDLEYIVDRYDGGVLAADAGLGLILDGLRERGLLDDTLVVVTSDHGEALLERPACLFTHDPFLYQETLRVPLVVRFPDAEHAGTVVDALVRHVDVVPTIHEVTDVRLQGDEQGRSLVELLSGADAAPRLLLAETKTRSAKETSAKVPKGEEGWLEERVALTDGKWKVIFDATARTWQLYDLEADPDEQTNLASSLAHVERVKEWRELLEAYRLKWPVAGDTTAVMASDTESLLGQTGYL